MTQHLRSFLPSFRLVATILSVVILAGALLTYRQLSHAPLIPNEPLTVTKSGTVLQSGKRVGQFIREGTRAVLHLEVSDAHASIARNYYLTLIWSESVSPDLLSSQITSIQGTDGMLITPLSSTEVHLFFNRVYPESHTVATVSIPADSLALPWSISLVSILLSITARGWFSVSTVLIIIGLGYGLVKTRRTRPRDHARRSVPPSNLSVLETAILMKSELTSLDIAALLYDLCNRGYLQIVSNERDTFFFRQRRKTTDRLYEEDILNLVVPVNNTGHPFSVAKVMNTIDCSLFSDAVSKLFVDAYQELTIRGYVQENPRLVHLYYKTVGITVQFLSLAQAIFAYFFLSTYLPGFVWIGVAGYVLGYIVYKVGYHLIDLTPLGEQAVAEAEAFTAYLADREPIGREDWQGYLFYQYLPFAIILGKTREWYQRFCEVGFSIPDWYTIPASIASPEQFVQGVFVVSEAISTTFVRLKNPNVD